MQVPETVSGRFTLVPIRGTDPVRALKSGVLVEVRVAGRRHRDPRRDPVRPPLCQHERSVGRPAHAREPAARQRAAADHPQAASTTPAAPGRRCGGTAAAEPDPVSRRADLLQEQAPRAHQGTGRQLLVGRQARSDRQARSKPAGAGVQHAPGRSRGGTKRSGRGEIATSPGWRRTARRATWNTKRPGGALPKPWRPAGSGPRPSSGIWSMHRGRLLGGCPLRRGGTADARQCGRRRGPGGRHPERNGLRR